MHLGLAKLSLISQRGLTKMHHGESAVIAWKNIEEGDRGFFFLNVCVGWGSKNYGLQPSGAEGGVWTVKWYAWRKTLTKMWRERGVLRSHAELLLAWQGHCVRWWVGYSQLGQTKLFFYILLFCFIEARGVLEMINRPHNKTAPLSCLPSQLSPSICFHHSLCHANARAG